MKKKAEAREPLTGFTLDGVTLTFNLDADYEVLRTQLTQNVVAVLDGSDPQLRSTYVALGAHYDHVGYADRELTSDVETTGRPRPRDAGRRITIASGTAQTTTGPGPWR